MLVFAQPGTRSFSPAMDGSTDLNTHSIHALQELCLLELFQLFYSRYTSLRVGHRKKGKDQQVHWDFRGPTE